MIAFEFIAKNVYTPITTTKLWLITIATCIAFRLICWKEAWSTVSALTFIAIFNAIIIKIYNKKYLRKRLISFCNEKCFDWYADHFNCKDEKYDRTWTNVVAIFNAHIFVSMSWMTRKNEMRGWKIINTITIHIKLGWIYWHYSWTTAYLKSLV